VAHLSEEFPVSVTDEPDGETPRGPVPGPPQDSRFIEAIVQVESRGESNCVGLAGERGLMQIQESTWYEVTGDLFEETISFDSAFDPALNRQVGTAYLEYLHGFLTDRQSAWDGRALHTMLAACYNAGPTCVARAGFELENLPAVTRSYVERVTALYEFYLRRDEP
jgi:soluble lytic murein transglycosylase-like protein